MGLFLSATAVRHAPADDVAKVVESWCSDHFVVCTEATGRDVPSGSKIDVHAPIEGWTTVLWPLYFIPYVEVAEHLSATLGTTVSAVNVYDSDCWQQVLVDRGEVVDRYATDPRYLASDLEPVDVVAPRWRGDPDAVAALLGCHARDVARHYRRNRRDRTFDDWGFVALWADEGITYPDVPSGAHTTFALGEDWFDVLNRVLRP
jgi:hypothetical protein